MTGGAAAVARQAFTRHLQREFAFENLGVTIHMVADSARSHRLSAAFYDDVDAYRSAFRDVVVRADNAK
jgi:hypothetical protein